MRSAIAILTYRRLRVLQETLKGISQHCSQYPLAVFEDCGQRDGTESWLSQDCQITPAPEYCASRCVPKPQTLSAAEQFLGTKTEPRYLSFLGSENLGVAGNSNRAIKWFMDETDADHLCLLNDDLHILGDFVATYARAHRDLDVGMFCFNDFTHHPSYRWATVRSRGHKLKLCPRYTGIMMSFTRKVVEDIGYFDRRFGKFGEDHCDYVIRARFAGHVSLDGAPQVSLDIDPEPPVLQHQDAETSVVGEERRRADIEAFRIMQRLSAEYQTTHYYRPFALKQIAMAGGDRNFGIPQEYLSGYAKVSDTAS